MERFEYVKMDIGHADDVMRILNHYTTNSFAVYHDQELPNTFFGQLIEMTKGYPAFVISLTNYWMAKRLDRSIF